MLEAPPVCRHCGKPLTTNRRGRRPRGLCWTCYYTPGVRDQYPVAEHNGAVRSPVQDFCGTGVRPDPTRAPPGTPEKVEVLAARAAARQTLFHPGDCQP